MTENFRPLSENYTAVATLPLNVVPVSKKSSAIERLLCKRENEYQHALELMKTNFQKFNLQTESEIRAESLKLQKCLTQTNSNMDNAMTKLIRGSDNENVNLNMETFDTAVEIIQKFGNERLDIIDGFYEILKNLEKTRLKHFKSILNLSYQKMGNIFYKLPQELLFYFEHEITKINEISMNNYFYYSKLHSDLKLQTADEMRFLILEIMEDKNKYRMAVKRLKVKSLVYPKHQEKPVQKEKNILDQFSEIQETSFTGTFPVTPTDLEIWSQQTQETLEVLDRNAKKLVNLYKKAVVNVFNRFFDELQRITDALLEEKKTVGQDINYLNTEIYKPIIRDITQQYAVQVTDLQKVWDSITTYMESNIKNTYTFLESSTHLWDDHFIRVDEAKELVLKDLKNLIDKNDKAAQNYEKKINTTIDKLREGSTVPKLNKHLDNANKLLDSIGKLFSNHCTAEIKILQKYFNLINKEIDVLLCEIERFLGENVKSENIQHQKKSFESLSDQDVMEDNLIPTEIKACRYQVNAVNNWMFGLWEAIRMYMTTCREELIEQATTWVDNQSSKLYKRLEVKMANHKPRYNRVKIMIYDVRFQELENHSHQFRKMEDNIYKCIKDAGKANEICKQDHQEILGDYKTKMLEIEDKIKSLKTSLQIESNIQQANVLTKDTEQKLEEISLDNNKLIDTNLINIKKLICQFSNSIKLFSEGGNYSSEEAKIFKKKIININKKIPKHTKSFLKEASIVRKQALEELEALKIVTFTKLKSSKEEFEHNEMIIMKIKELQSKIRRKAYEVKFQINRVEAYVDYFATVSKINIWKHKNFEIMKESLIESIDRASKLTNYVIYSNKMEKDIKFINREEKLNATKSTNDIMTDKTYMYELLNLIQTSLKEIQNIAKSFYQQHGKILNEGKIQPNYDAFMNEIEKTFEKFKIQIEIHCIDCAEELIHHILKLLKINDEIYDDMIAKYPNVNLKDNKEVYNKLFDKLNEEYKDLRNRKLSLQQSDQDIKMSVQNRIDPNIATDSNTINVTDEYSNSTITEIILKNDQRVDTLNNLLNKLFSHVKDNLYVLENFTKIEKHDNDDKNIITSTL